MINSFHNSEADFQVESVRKILNAQNKHEQVMIEELSEWNIIPYGQASECKNKLLIILDGNYEPSDIFRRALNHLTMYCKGKTMLVVLYVEIDMNIWQKKWKTYEAEFSTIESSGVDIRILFNRSL